MLSTVISHSLVVGTLTSSFFSSRSSQSHKPWRTRRPDNLCQLQNVKWLASRLSQIRSHRGQATSACVTDTGSFIVNKQGLRLWKQSWTPARGSCKAKVLLHHGYTWHSGYFEELALFLADDGYTVHTFDMQSHGKSDNNGDLRGHFSKFTNLVDDLQLMVAGLGEELPGKPIYVYGESLGGLVALLMAAERPEQVAGLILAAPVVKVAASILPPPPLLAAMRLLSRVLPRTRLPMQELKDTYLGAFGDQVLAVASLEDPLVVFQTPTLRVVGEIITATNDLEAVIHRITAPLMVMHGTEDVRTECANSIDLINKVASTSRTLRVYPGMKHQLLQETAANKQLVFKDIVTWLNTQTVG